MSAPPFIRKLVEPPGFDHPPNPCPYCGAQDLWELRLMDDDPFRGCLGCCRERTSTRIQIEIKRLAKSCSLAQLDAEELDTRLVYIRQRLRVIERMTLNYQKMRRIKQ
jgi:hypothetical protein